MTEFQVLNSFCISGVKGLTIFMSSEYMYISESVRFSEVHENFDNVFHLKLIH